MRFVVIDGKQTRLKERVERWSFIRRGEWSSSIWNIQFQKLFRHSSFIRELKHVVAFSIARFSLLLSDSVTVSAKWLWSRDLY
jgi:hypothetical protein